MKLLTRATALGKKITLITTAFILAVSTLTAAVPFILAQNVNALGPVVEIDTVAELRSAVENQADGQIWEIAAGNYGVSPFTSLTVSGQTGWYFPITANNLTIKGVGNPTIYGTGYSPNGNWATQNLVSVFGDNVTIDGLTLMPKVQPNKTLEVLGNNFTLRNTTFTPNTLTSDAEFASSAFSDWSRQWGGSLYFNHAGNHVVENVTIKNAGISYRYSPSGTHIAFTNTKIVYETNQDSINTYRYSSAFNNAGNTVTGAIEVEHHVNATLNNLALVASSAQNGDVIELDSDVTTTAQTTLTKAVTLNGNGHTITGNFVKTDNDNNSVLGVQSDNVAINGLTVDAVTGANQLHGINVFESNGVALTNIAAKNGRSGVAVNGSAVTIDGIQTSGNVWHGVNIDKPGAHLTIKGANTHTEAAPLFVDNRTVGQVTDVDNRYDIIPAGLGDIYVLDVTAPDVPTHEFPTENALINTNNFWFDWSDESASGAVRYEIQNSQSAGVDGNGSFQNVQWTGDYQHNQPTDSKAQSVGASGTWYWQVRAIDAAGNTSAWTTPWAVTIDVNAPTAPQITTPVNNQVFTTNSITANWTAATDANGISKYQVEYIYDDGHTFAGGPYREVNGSTTSRTHAPATSEQGGVTIRVRAFDNANNAGPWSNPVHYYYDNTKPTATINSASVDTAAKTLAVSVTGKDNQSGVARIGFNLYNASNSTKVADLQTLDYTDFAAEKTSVLSNFDISGLPTGTYVVRAAVRDNAGLLSSYALQTIQIDNTLPVATFIFPTAGPSATGFQVQFSEAVSPVDAENAANYFLNNWPGAGGSGDLVGDATVSYNATSRIATVTFTNAGWYISPEQQWGVKNVRDLAGNSITETTKTSTDMVAPELPANPVTTSATDSLEQVWTWGAATDPGDATTASGVKGYEYAFVKSGDPADGWVFTAATTATVTAPEDGDYQLYVRALDNAGNVGIAKIGFVTINTTTEEVPVDPGEEGEEGEETETPGAPTSETPPTTLSAEDDELPAANGNPATGFAAILGTNTTGNNDASDDTDTTGTPEVEGTSTEETLAAAANNTDGNAFGLAWYWWLVILAGGATGIWWLIAALRGRSAE